jgi:hypothetical protein
MPQAAHLRHEGVQAGKVQFGKPCPRSRSLVDWLVRLFTAYGVLAVFKLSGEPLLPMPPSSFILIPFLEDVSHVQDG